MDKPRVLLADDNSAVADALAEILEGEFDVVGMVSDGLALLRAAQELRPDIIITDISMPLMNGVEAIRELRKARSTAKIIALTVHKEAELAAALFRDGASGYVVKHDAGEELLVALHEVISGRLYVPALITGRNEI